MDKLKMTKVEDKLPVCNLPLFLELKSGVIIGELSTIIEDGKLKAYWAECLDPPKFAVGVWYCDNADMLEEIPTRWAYIPTPES